jgi:hypothetical protein
MKAGIANACWRILVALRKTSVPLFTPMIHFAYNADILTSARMAAGMTSRARRPRLYPSG